MPERIPLEAVLFDAGGTLVRLDFEWMSERLRSYGLEVPVDRLRRGEIEGRRRYDASRGPAPRPGDPVRPLGAIGITDAYYRGMVEAAGVRSDVIPALLVDFERRHAEVGLWNRPLEGARAAIDGIAALGFRRAVVSNSDGRAEQHLIDCGVREGLEFVVDSQRVGLEKPDPRILKLALDRMGIAADRALYVGDIRSVDEAVARAAGSHFVLVDPYGDYGPEIDSVASMFDLPAHVAGRFMLPLEPARPDRTRRA